MKSIGTISAGLALTFTCGLRPLRGTSQRRCLGVTRCRPARPLGHAEAVSSLCEFTQISRQDVDAIRLIMPATR